MEIQRVELRWLPTLRWERPGAICCGDTLWFALDPIPDVRELAERSGDLHVDHVHVGEESLRQRGFDRVQQE